MLAHTLRTEEHHSAEEAQKGNVMSQEVSHEQTNTYIIDPENVLEMDRLIEQGHLITKGLGDAFSEGEEIVSSRTILDIGCGPGEWIRYVAKKFPQKKLIGIDISHIELEYAQVCAEAERISNVEFLAMNALEPLKFPDAFFDLVNGRLVSGFMQRDAWLPLLKECMRILRPGGILRITEGENLSHVGSPTSVKLSELLVKAFWKAGMGFASNGVSAAYLPKLLQFFRDAGYQDVQMHPSVIDCSFGSEYHQAAMKIGALFYRNMKPFLVDKHRVVSAKKLEQMAEQLYRDQQSPDFASLWYWLTISGRRPIA